VTGELTSTIQEYIDNKLKTYLEEDAKKRDTWYELFQQVMSDKLDKYCGRISAHCDKNTGKFEEHYQGMTLKFQETISSSLEEALESLNARYTRMHNSYVEEQKKHIELNRKNHKVAQENHDRHHDILCGYLENFTKLVNKLLENND